MTETVVQLPRSSDAPRQARHLVRDFVAPERVDDAMLLVSELVTNAIRHAGLEEQETIRLVVETDDRGMRVEVSDRGPGFELTEPAPDPSRPSGWGLYLVRELSDRWGIDRDGGTRVWFELDRDAA